MENKVCQQQSILQRKTQITCSKSKRPPRILSSFSSQSDFSSLVLILAIIFFSVLQSSLNYTSESNKGKRVRPKSVIF